MMKGIFPKFQLAWGKDLEGNPYPGLGLLYDIRAPFYTILACAASTAPPGS